jgi:uncharacterized protein YqeY
VSGAPEGTPARIEAELVAAMRAGDDDRKRTLRSLKAAIKNAEIEAVSRGKLALGASLDEAAVQAVLRTQAKQRRDAIELYDRGGRPELSAIERAELAIIEGYLPQPLGLAEVEAAARAQIQAVGATSPADLGKVMGPLSKSLAGRVDGKVLSDLVRRLLAG